jgi:DNA-binding Lrp family transcriptional regulator
MDVKQAIGATVAPLWELHAQATKERDELRAKLADVDDTVRQLEKMLRVGDPDNPMWAKQENGKTASGRTVSEKTVTAVHRAMWKDAHRTFTITELAREMGLSASTVDNAMTELRARGIVRAIGRIPNPIGRGPAVMGFKIGENVPPPLEQALIAEVDRNGWEPTGQTLRAWNAIQQLDRDRFVFLELLDIDPEIPKGSQTYMLKSLEEHGLIRMVEKGQGGKPNVYELVENGS